MKKRTIKDIANLLVYIVGIVIIFNFVGGHTLRIVNISLIYAIVALGLSLIHISILRTSEEERHYS